MPTEYQDTKIYHQIFESELFIFVSKSKIILPKTKHRNPVEKSSSQSFWEVP